MAKVQSKKEKRLQRKLIPLNIVVCVLALVAALTLFLTPIIKVDFGKILRDDGVMEFVDDMIDDSVGGDLEGSGQEGIDYKPVITALVKNILGKAEGSISISAVGGFRVMTAGENKTQEVLDDLFFGKKALATKLINSVVDGIADMFETKEGKQVLEEAIVSTVASQVLNNIEDGAVREAVEKDVKEILDIFSELGDPAKVPDGKVDQVAGKLVDKIDDLLGDDLNIDDDSKKEFINQIQEIYDNTKKELKEGETISIETIICVTISQNIDLSEINIAELFDGIFGDSKESSVHIKSVDLDLGDKDEGDPDADDGNDDADENEGAEGGNGEGENNKKDNVIVTNYNDLLEQMGFDKEAKENLKEKMRTTLNNELTKLIEDNGIDEFLGYYEYVFYAMLIFIVPWLILFLFSFFHIFAKNKRFTMWYVKLICWIPSVIWLALTLLPTLANKFFPDMFEGSQGPLIKAIFNGISSFTWINGLCYVLLWLVSIFWAFPIKRKIRKERKNPEIDVDQYDEDGNFGDGTY